MSNLKAIERIQISREEFFEIEQQIRLQEHIRRYAAIRRFIYGNVLDFACGCGYGTFLLASSPEVETILGVDIDQESITWAEKNYSTEKCHFVCKDVTEINQPIDTLISLETIEHFNDNAIYHSVINNCNPSQLIFSYPNKKSTHFNPYHQRDLNKQELLNSFPDFLLLHNFNMGDVDFLIFVRKPEKMPVHIYNNILDFK